MIDWVCATKSDGGVVTKQGEEGEMNVKWGIMGEGGVKNK